MHNILLLSPKLSLAQNIAELASSAGLTTLVDLVVKAGLADTLSNGGPFTVVAPTNEAFARLPQDVLDAVNRDVDLLKKVLLYHVVSGEVRSNQIVNDMTAPSVEGTELRLNVYPATGTVTVNGKRVVNPNVSASNGVVHVIDEVW